MTKKEKNQKENKEKKEKQIKKKNTNIKEDKKCSTKIQYSLPKYKRTEIKGRFSTGTSR